MTRNENVNNKRQQTQEQCKYNLIKQDMRGEKEIEEKRKHIQTFVGEVRSERKAENNQGAMKEFIFRLSGLTLSNVQNRVEITAH